MNTRTEKLMEMAGVEYNSKKNLEIKNLLLIDNVHSNITHLMKIILEQENEIDLDFDIENFYYYPNISSEEGNVEFRYDTDKSEQIEYLETTLDKMNLKDIYYSEIWNFVQFLKNDFELSREEVTEWWTVSSMLYEVLKEKGEVVLRYGPTIVWGRRENKCRMIADSIISEIADDMKILEGQQNEWELT